MAGRLLTITEERGRLPLEEWLKEEHRGFAAEVAALIRQWRQGVSFFTLQTSGSTGPPRRESFPREFVTERARVTADALGLRPGQTALLALPVHSAGGFMVLMRALVLPMHLILRRPSTQPLSPDDGPIDFAAFTPHQAAVILKNTPERFAAISTVILGGAPLDPTLEERLRRLPNTIYHTYGMTETLSHIALRNVSKGERFFRPLPDVRCTVTDQGTLRVEFPRFGRTVETTDRVRLHPDGIEWLGRLDFVINSGGVKLHPEEIERKLAAHSDVRRWRADAGLVFYITAAPHPTLGECVALVYEAAHPIGHAQWQRIAEAVLPPYARPRRIVRSSIARTATGKIIRRRLVE